MARAEALDMQWYQLGIYEKAMPNRLSIEEKIICARNSGFDYMELSIDEKDEKLARLDWSAEERHTVRCAMEKNEFRIGSICLSGHRRFPFGARKSPDASRSREIMEKAILLARDLGIPLIQLAGYDVYYEEGNVDTRRQFEETLRWAASLAARFGVLLGFETMETPFMDTVEKAMHFVRRVESPYLGVYPDIGNLKNASLIYKTPVNEDLETGRGHLFAAHLKETVPGRYREVPFGTGHTDYIETIRCLKDLGVRRFVGEFWDIGSDDWETTVRDANAFLRKKLNAVD